MVYAQEPLAFEHADSTNSAAPYLLLGGVAQELHSQLTAQNFKVNESFVGAGYQFSDRWSIETTYLNSEISLANSQSGVGYRKLSLTAIYNFPLKSMPGFQLRGGISTEKFSSNNIFNESDYQILFGAGYTFQLNQNLSLVFAAEASQALERKTTEQKILTEIQYRFPSSTTEVSKPSKNMSVNPLSKEPPAPQDDDKDGVINSIDQCPDTPLHYMVDNKGCKRFIIDNESITLQINFEIDSIAIADEYKEQLESIARFLRKHSTLTMIIEGHTDNSGSSNYNLMLSQKRAEAIAQYLSMNLEVEPDRLTAIGFGDAKPIATNATAKGQQLNRRVEAKLTAQTERPILRK